MINELNARTRKAWRICATPHPLLYTVAPPHRVTAIEWHCQYPNAISSWPNAGAREVSRTWSTSYFPLFTTRIAGCPTATKPRCYFLILMLNGLTARACKMLLHFSSPSVHTHTALSPNLVISTLLLFNINEIWSQVTCLQIVAPHITLFSKQLHCYVAKSREMNTVTTSCWYYTNLIFIFAKRSKNALLLTNVLTEFCTTLLSGRDIMTLAWLIT